MFVILALGHLSTSKPNFVLSTWLYGVSVTIIVDTHALLLQKCGSVLKAFIVFGWLLWELNILMTSHQLIWTISFTFSFETTLKSFSNVSCYYQSNIRSTHRDALLIVSRLLSLVAGIWKFEIYLLQKYTYLPESTNWGDSTYYFQGCTYAFVFSTSSYKRNLVNKDDQISTESLITIDNCYFYSGTWHRHYVLFPAGFRC